ncbi:RNA polymerase subunit sigma-70 [Lutibacter profundi]|uniref:RNA polymerase subunit sigma-70 n=1 Tax=Lutibacter profundi TaxID=1622118 RepID=A0A120IEC6_9FLAO|nr:RNA polymerase sigma factor [Lutibacter profundi]AMC11229.1 RNA polymerase subunit sigma-70 [Lutibacter profundi]
MGLNKLIKQCAKNDRKAQEEIYQLFAGKLFSICLKYSKNKQEAQDNFQDGFVTIFNKIGQFKFKGSFEGWLKRIMVNTILLKYRQKNVLNIVVTEEIPDEVIVDVDDEEISLDFLLNLIQELPDRYRMVFNLYVLDGYSHKEISKMLCIAEGTSKSNLARARAILKNKIELHQEEQQSV